VDDDRHAGLGGLVRVWDDGSANNFGCALVLFVRGYEGPCSIRSSRCQAHDEVYELAGAVADEEAVAGPRHVSDKSALKRLQAVCMRTATENWNGTYLPRAASASSQSAEG
jgi:hypothetical protein